MALNQNPVFRDPVAPWHDTKLPCNIQIGFMIIVIIFSIVGIFTSFGRPEFKGLCGIPILLFILSCYVLISTTIRLSKRKTSRSKI
ncbi:MAG: hypothetical protein B6I31_00520 [Desulfobacteraceae bacterium 4572_19]|nr:MAG: hypothetical protein B6I31_00520 [Desulfobacteraceae bacterium 4572_19]